MDRMIARRWSRTGILLSLVLGLMLASGCESGSRISKSWRDPNFAGPIQFKKVVALVIHPEKYVRKNGEDEIVRQLGPDRCVAGYTFLSDEELADVNKVKAKLKENGFDGAIALRVAGSRTASSYVPQAGNDTPFYSYYDRSGAFMTDPGYSQSETAVLVDVKIWSVRDEKLIWSGTSETFSPSGTANTVAEIGKAVGKELRKEKLL